MKYLLTEPPYRLLFLFLWCLHGQALGANEADTKETNVSEEIAAIIASRHHPYLTHTNFSNLVEDVEDLYRRVENDLFWLNNDRAEKNIEEVIQLLARAADNGLDAQDYNVEWLKFNLPFVLNSPQASLRDLVIYDSAISISLLRFLHDLRYGRVNPLEISFQLKPRDTKPLHLALLIKNSVESGTIPGLTLSVEPRLKQYQQLKQALADYRKLSDKNLSTALDFGRSLHPRGC